MNKQVTPYAIIYPIFSVCQSLFATKITAMTIVAIKETIETKYSQKANFLFLFSLSFKLVKTSSMYFDKPVFTFSSDFLRSSSPRFIFSSCAARISLIFSIASFSNDLSNLTFCPCTPYSIDKSLLLSSLLSKNAENPYFMRTNAVTHSTCLVLGNRSTGWTFSVR